MLKIRKAVPSDAKEIILFQRFMAKETEGVELERDVITNGVEAVFEDESKGLYFVVTDGKKVAGSFLVTEEWSDWRNGTILWMQSVFVLPEYRGNGAFNIMYNYLKSLVENNESLKGIRLYVEKNNQNAQKVYSRKGMQNEHYDMFEWMK